jgi:hypothetical protein
VAHPTHIGVEGTLALLARLPGYRTAGTVPDDENNLLRGEEMGNADLCHNSSRSYADRVPSIRLSLETELA